MLFNARLAPGREVRVGKPGKAFIKQLTCSTAEKNDDRHIRNKIEGVNRSRGEAAETIHHLFMAKLKGYITEEAYLELKGRYKECIRMLNGLEKTLEQKLPERERRWQVKEESFDYGSNVDTQSQGWPVDV